MYKCSPEVGMTEHIPRKYFQETKRGRIFFLPVAGHPAVIVDFGIQPIFLGQSVAELVRTCVRSRRQLSFTQEKVGRAHAPMHEGEVWIQFDSLLIEFERSLSVASQEEFGSLSAGLECFQGGAGRCFQRLIESGQGFGWLPELP